MKDNNFNELKPVYIHELNSSKNNEISFIDLALILIKRKWIVINVLIITIIVITIYTIQKPTLYTYSTTVEIGNQMIDGVSKPLENTETVQAKLNYSFIPQVLNEQRLPNSKYKKNFNIVSNIPNKSTIIILETQGIEEHADTISNILSAVTKKIIKDHGLIYDAIKQNITISIQQTKSELTALYLDKNKKIDIIQPLELKIENNKSQLANLRNTREILPPTRSLKPTGSNKKLIIIITAFAGIIVGVFAAFFTEFLSKVKREMNKDKI